MKLFALVISSLALVACGGGGGGGGGGDVVATDFTVSGAVVKGPMAKAKVSVHKATAAGLQGELLADVTTNDDGVYTAKIPNYDGVVIVVASVVAGQTTMYDEATGQTITPEADFTLRASFAAKRGDTQSAQINPYTELATASALTKTGGLSATNVAQANSDMAATMTFNPLTTAAEFDTNKKPKNAAAVAVAAVSDLAAAGGQGCNMGNQAKKVACVVAAMGKKGLADKDLKDELTEKIRVIASSANLPSQGISDAAGTPVTAATPIAQAKAFIATLRSNAKALDATDMSLQTELDKVATDFKERTVPIATSNLEALRMALNAVQFWNDVVKSPNAEFVSTKSFYDNTQSSFGRATSSCGIYSDTDYLNLATSRTDAKYVACSPDSYHGFSFYGGNWYPYFFDENWVQPTDSNGLVKPCTAVGELCFTNWSARTRVHPNLDELDKFNVYTVTRETRYNYKGLAYIYYDPVTGRTVTDLQSCPSGQTCNSYPTTNLTRTNYGAALPGNAATLITQRNNIGKVVAFNLSGELSPAFVVEKRETGVVFSPSCATGGPCLPVYTTKIEQKATVLGDKHNIALNVSVSTSNALDRLSFSGSMDLIKSGVMETKLELLDGSYFLAKPDQVGSYSYNTFDSRKALVLKLKVSTLASAIAGTLTLDGFKADKSASNYEPTEMTFAGEVQRSGAAFLSGVLKMELPNYADFDPRLLVSAANPKIYNMGFQGDVAIPSRPALRLTLSSTETDSGNQGVSAVSSGQYVQGYQTVNIAGTRTPAKTVTTLESTTGVKVVLDSTTSIIPLFVGAEEVGRVSGKTIYFSDNSIESF